MAQIVGYFVEAVAADNKKSQDFKSLRASSFQMFKEGHVQKIVLKYGFETVIIKCDCLPEMRKDRIYKIVIRLHSTTGEIQFAKCCCVAGKGPTACCKHIASVCYALEEFRRIFLTSDEVACTDVLQKWNQPRKRRLSPRKISDLDFSIEQANKVKRKTNLQGRRPEEIVGQVRDSDLSAIDLFVSRLSNFRKEHPTEKLSIYSVLNTASPLNANYKNDIEPAANISTSDTMPTEQSNIGPQSIWELRASFKENLKKSNDERMELFNKTKEQSDCALWFEEREGRITGSVCGKIINRNQSLYPTSILNTLCKTTSIRTAAMAMGKEQEPRILARYILHQKDNGHPNITVENAGFLVDKGHGWLGASPDGVVFDHSSKGCAEIKAAVSFWECSISEAINSPKPFCLCFDSNNAIQIKQRHVYYHQCQLQLFVGRDMFEFCDFVVATENDLFVQRIYLDKEWVSTQINELECFYDSFVLPRLVI